MCLRCFHVRLHYKYKIYIYIYGIYGILECIYIYTHTLYMYIYIYSFVYNYVCIFSWCDILDTSFMDIYGIFYGIFVFRFLFSSAASEFIAPGVKISASGNASHGKVAKFSPGKNGENHQSPQVSYIISIWRILMENN